MARIRTVKPDFFRHSGLYRLEVETRLPIRLAFAGLWTAADREGRFKWDPDALKLDALPYDQVDFSRVLDALATRGFIRRYASSGREFGVIPSWHDHQAINPRETASVLPDPEKCEILPNKINGLDASPTRDSRVDNASATRHNLARGEGKGREGKEIEIPKGISCELSTESPPARSDPIPYQAILDAYNQTMADLPKARDLTAKRKTAIRKVWSGKRKSLEFWSAYFAECQDDKFHNGTGPYANGHENWRPNFDYLIREDVVIKIFERAMHAMERAR